MPPFADKEKIMKTRLPFLTIVVLGSGLSFAASSAYAQQPHPADAAPPPGTAMGNHAAPHPRFSAADRAAFFDAHLAGLHAGLALTPDQEKLWPPVEAALRAGAKSADARMEQERTGPHPANAIAWLRKLSDEDIAKGETLKALADAAAPLYDTLTEEQKHRLPFLLHGIRPHAFGAGDGDHEGMHEGMGEHGGPEGMHGMGEHSDHEGMHEGMEGHGEPE
jgi:zinc resistance-associated protein